MKHSIKRYLSFAFAVLLLLIITVCSCERTDKTHSSRDSEIEISLGSILGNQSSESDSSDLTYGKTVNVFDHIRVEFSGISGGGVADVIYESDEEWIKACRLDIESNCTFKNGDVALITVKNADIVQVEYGIELSELSREYAVPALPEYATSETVPVNVFSGFAEQYLIDSDNTSENTAFISESKPRLYGIYFMERRETAITSSRNQVQILICSDQYIEGKYSKTIYVPLIYKNIVIKTDGSVDVKYEDGHGTGFAYNDGEKCLKDCEEDFIVTELVSGEKYVPEEDNTSKEDDVSSDSNEKPKPVLCGDTPVIVDINGVEYALTSYEEAAALIPFKTAEKGFTIVFKRNSNCDGLVLISNGDGTYDAGDGYEFSANQLSNRFHNHWCRKCGLRSGDGSHGTCQVFTCDTDCPLCGEPCKKLACHTCDE